MGHSKLTQKQEGFASDVANKTYKFIWEAYAAHYNTKGMSQNTIYQESCRLLANPKVTARIQEIEEKIKLKEKVTLDEIIVKLSQRVNLDIREMYNDDGSFKNPKELTQEQAMFLNSFDVSEIWGFEIDEESGKKERTQIGVMKKVKLESIKDMLDMLIRHYGGYAKDNEQKVGDLEAIREVVFGKRDNEKHQGTDK